MFFFSLYNLHSVCIIISFSILSFFSPLLNNFTFLDIFIIIFNCNQNCLNCLKKKFFFLELQLFFIDSYHTLFKISILNLLEWLTPAPIPLSFLAYSEKVLGVEFLINWFDCVKESNIIFTSLPTIVFQVVLGILIPHNICFVLSESLHYLSFQHCVFPLLP